VLTTGNPCSTNSNCIFYPVAGGLVPDKQVSGARSGDWRDLRGDRHFRATWKTLRTEPRCVVLPGLIPGTSKSSSRGIDDPPSIEELAVLCDLSPAHFSRLVRRIFHLTPSRLAMKARIDEALHY